MNFIFRDMKQNKEYQELDLNQIPEPENIDDVIYSLMVNPNLTPLNYFNDFSDVLPDPKKIGIMYFVVIENKILIII